MMLCYGHAFDLSAQLWAALSLRGCVPSEEGWPSTCRTPGGAPRATSRQVDADSIVLSGCWQRDTRVCRSRKRSPILALLALMTQQTGVKNTMIWKNTSAVQAANNA